MVVQRHQVAVLRLVHRVLHLAHRPLAIRQAHVDWQQAVGQAVHEPGWRRMGPFIEADQVLHQRDDDGAVSDRMPRDERRVGVGPRQHLGVLQLNLRDVERHCRPGGVSVGRPS